MTMRCFNERCRALAFHVSCCDSLSPAMCVVVDVLVRVSLTRLFLSVLSLFVADEVLLTRCSQLDSLPQKK